MKNIAPVNDFTKAIFLSYVTALAISIVILITIWQFVSLGFLQFYAAAVLVFLLSGACVAWLLNRALRKPLKVLHSQLDELQQQVHSSTNALTSVNKRTEALQEALPFGLIVFDEKAQLSLVNNTALKMLSLSGSRSKTIDGDVVLAKMKELSSGNHPVDLLGWFSQTKSNKIQDQKLWSFVQTGESEESQSFDIMATYNKNDTYGHELVIVLIDRTADLQRQEKQMEFISLAAHELRGPITVMRGLIDVFQSEVGEALDNEHRELLVRMAVSARQLASYVDNILGVSRVDQQNFNVRLSEGNWKKIIEKGTLDLVVRAQANHRKLQFKIPEGLATAAVDAEAIMHVINNLVDNAIKYSKPEGEIVVSVIQKDDIIETTVQDFGIGMPASVVDGLFTKFYRSHRSKQIVSGTGLGLYLCKAIIEAHGGNIWVRSSEGVGTTFGFTLPTYQSVAEKLKKSQSERESDIVRGSHGWIKNHALVRQ